MHDSDATYGIRIREATAADADVVARHRAAMFIDMGSLDAASADAATIVEATVAIVARAIPDGEWTGWIAEDADGAVGSGGAIVRRLYPRPGSPRGGEVAYLLNFYTEPRARRRGVATEIMRACLAWCRQRGVVRVELHASAAGRRVYERLGFVPRDGEMVWDPGRSCARVIEVDAPRLSEVA